MTNPLWGPLDGFLAYIASRGYVTVAITHRFASEAKSRAQLQDTKTAVRFLRANAQRFGIDPNRIAVMGESAGGSVAAMAGTTCGVDEFEGEGYREQSSCIQAAIDWYGVCGMNQLDAQAGSTAIDVTDLAGVCRAVTAS
jgi:dienelactone hydrolase